MFLYPNVSNYLSVKSQIDIIKEYKEKVENLDENIVSTEYESATIYNDNVYKLALGYNTNRINLDNYNQVLNLGADGIMAYLEIPKIKVDLPIYHGTGDDVLSKGVGHIKNSSLPIGGKSTHCILTGHTGLVKAKLFTRLNELEENDFFYINILGKKLVYKVSGIKIILPTEIQDLQIVEGKDLVTLVTCTPYGVNTHRLLVTGEQIDCIKENMGKNRKMEIEEEKVKEKDNYYYVGIIYGVVFLLTMMFIVKVLKLT